MELLATRNIPKDGISFPLSLHTFFSEICADDTIPTGPDSAATSLKETCFRRTRHISRSPLPGRERGGGAVTRGNEIFFYSLPSKIQSYFYLTTEEMKTFWPPSRPSTTTTVLPYCANRNIIEIRIPNSGKQFLESKTLILLLCWCWGKRGNKEGIAYSSSPRGNSSAVEFFSYRNDREFPRR